MSLDLTQPTRIPSYYDRFPFGKYKGEQYEDVPASYFDWLREQSWLNESYPEVAAYIKNNSKMIDLELKRELERHEAHQQKFYQHEKGNPSEYGD